MRKSSNFMKQYVISMTQRVIIMTVSHNYEIQSHNQEIRSHYNDVLCDFIFPQVAETEVHTQYASIF